MKHLVQNANKTFDVVTIAKNGEYLNGSNQGYERREGAFKNMRAVMKEDGLTHTYFQDDTEPGEVVVYKLEKSGRPLFTSQKPQKRYVPGKK